MSLKLERHWYRRSLTGLIFLLLPFSWLFRLVVNVRLFLYKHNILKTIHFSVPVIVVGNITVGGTGKTPLVVWLANKLKNQKWRPGIVSRGMGGARQQQPVWVDYHSEPQQVGDEAILLARQTTCPIVVCVDRVAAVKELLNHSDCNIVISDDGLQHYRLGRLIEIAVIDGDRQLGNGHMLPAGPLREPASRLIQVDFIVQQGGELHCNHYQMQLVGNELVSIGNPQLTVPLVNFKNKKVHAVAAIGNPSRFFAALRSQELEVIEHVFPDHYLYHPDDFNFSDSLPIVMTEKDKIKCEEFANDKFWYLPVVAHIDQKFEEEIVSKLHR